MSTEIQKQNQNLPSQPKKVDVLKSMLNAPSVMEQFRNALAKNAPTFVASVIDLYNTDSKLQLCEPKQVVMEALKAAVLHLPINRSLGYAYIIPFNNTKKVQDESGRDRYVKVMEPTFQMGYKGYIQLAMRTGQYRTINSDVVYEGELDSVNKLTGDISFDGEKRSDRIVGYFCHLELLNGFSKTLYMTVEQMANHAKRYSKGLGKDVTVESLVALSEKPFQTDSKVVGWMGNFHAMALKTVIRLLLGKYGYLSIEMQNAIVDDETGDTQEVRDTMIQSGNAADEVDMDDASYEEVTGQSEVPASDAPAEEDPGY